LEYRDRLWRNHFSSIIIFKLSNERKSLLKTKTLLLIFPFFFLITFIPACGNNPYPPESDQLIGYTALGEDPRTLDPAQVSDTTSAEILCQFYDALYQNAYLDRPYRVVPALAAGYPEKRIFYEDAGKRGNKKESKDGIYIQTEGRHPFPG
jgi:hypothetical protein